MGSPQNEESRIVDEPQHKVTVSQFVMGKYEVTIGEWNLIMTKNLIDVSPEHTALPATNIGWEEAIQYCNRRSIREGLTPCYSLYGETDPDNWLLSRVSTVHTNLINVSCDFSANGYRLPTEAEWEYACRAGTTTATAFGNSPTEDEINFNQKKWNAYMPVGSFRPNAWGLYDMHGNAWEWCWDRYQYYLALPQIDPENIYGVRAHVRRGGSCSSPFTEIRSAYRSAWGYYWDEGTGFRIVRSVR